ncbi:hypothetical protein [Olleya sp. R77988]|uniref:hypothetical protein n=1 Tax=Olleya sp. R77988 TaxID=3093875 RepID=UPI0037C508AF
MFWKRKTKYENLKLSLEKEVYEYLKNKGFQKDAQDLVFKKNTDFGFEIFELEYLITSEELKIGFGLRFNEIEDIYDQIHQIELPKNSFTIYIDSSQLLYFKERGKAKFSFNQIDDIKIGINNVKYIFENFAELYFQRYGSIEKVSNLLNRKKHQEDLKGNFQFHGTKEDAAINGIIASKILNEKDIEELKTNHLRWNKSNKDLKSIFDSIDKLNI